MSSENLKLTLKVWRQKNAQTQGAFETYKLDNVSTHMSFLEMMDVLNEQLNHEGKTPVTFDIRTLALVRTEYDMSMSTDLFRIKNCKMNYKKSGCEGA